MKINAATHLEHTRRWGRQTARSSSSSASALSVASRRARRPGLIAGRRPESLAHPDRRTPAASNSGVLTGRLLTRTRRHAMMGLVTASHVALPVASPRARILAGPALCLQASAKPASGVERGHAEVPQAAA
jgi:hypothetical protein